MGKHWVSLKDYKKLKKNKFKKISYSKLRKKIIHTNL